MPVTLSLAIAAVFFLLFSAAFAVLGRICDLTIWQLGILILPNLRLINNLPVRVCENYVH